MKKTTVQIVIFLAAGLLFVSCDKKRLPEVEAAADNASQGILGKAGKQLVYLIDDYYAELEAYHNQEPTSNRDIAIGEEEHSKNRAENEQKIRDFLTELSKVEIETEVADDVPIKIIRPFKVNDVHCNGIGFDIVVELTEGRQHIRRPHYYNEGTFYPTVIPFSDDDSLDIKLPTLTSKAIRNLNQDLEAGYRDTLEFGMQVADYVNPQSRISKFLGAKKLVIKWDKITDAIKVDLSKYYGELGIFNLHGLVQKCVWKTPFQTKTLEFDEDGKWIKENAGTPDANYPKVVRDEEGRRVKASDSWGETFLEYKYDNEGRIVKNTINYMDGGSETTYTYDAQGNQAKANVVYFGMDAEEGDDEVFVYTILESDDYNNWTKRKNQNGQIETRIITYYE